MVGLSNISHHLTLLLADFECFVLYYSRFCAFCVRYGFNSSYYHINKPLRICATLCHAWIIPEQNASKIVKIYEQVAKLWRKLKWLVFFWDTVYVDRNFYIPKLQDKDTAKIHVTCATISSLWLLLFPKCVITQNCRQKWLHSWFAWSKSTLSYILSSVT